MTDPVLHLVAGPNGAGKSTFYEEILGPVTGLPFINADQIAARRWPGRELEHAYKASAMATRERDRLMKRRASFATETVFSHPSKLDLLRTAKESGYRLTLHIVLIPEELAVARVRQRVVAGGHDVPDEKIRGRFSRLWTHLHQAIQLCDESLVYDNSRADRPYRRVAEFVDGRPIRPPDWPPWTPPELPQPEDPKSDRGPAHDRRSGRMSPSRTNVRPMSKSGTSRRRKVALAERGVTDHRPTPVISSMASPPRSPERERSAHTALET